MEKVYLLYRTDGFLYYASKQLVFVGSKQHLCFQAAKADGATETQVEQLMDYNQSQTNSTGNEYLIDTCEVDKMLD